MLESECHPGGTSSLKSPPWPDSFRKPRQMLRPSAAKCVFLFEMPGRGVRLVITSVVTNRTFFVKCALVRAKRSLSRHCKTARAKYVVWPTPNTYFRASSNSEFPSELEKPVRVAAATRIASGSLLGGAWQAEPRLLRNLSKLYL